MLPRFNRNNLKITFNAVWNATYFISQRNNNFKKFNKLPQLSRSYGKLKITNLTINWSIELRIKRNWLFNHIRNADFVIK